MDQQSTYKYPIYAHHPSNLYSPKSRDSMKCRIYNMTNDCMNSHQVIIYIDSW